MVKILTRDQESLLKEIDKEVRNKFRWEWLEKKVTVKVKVGKDFEEITESLANFVKKCDVPGKALCSYCNDLINYGSRGCIALTEHAVKVRKHAENIAIRRSNYSLGSAFSKLPSSSTSGVSKTSTAASIDTTHWGTLAKPVSDSSENSQPLTPIADRQVQSEALILGVLAEHCLPLTLAPVLVNTAKELAKDPRALAKVSLERKAASYKMTHGLGKTFTDETIENMHRAPFSLNMDESTSNNDKRILAILVSYVCPKTQKVVVEHLKSIELFKVDTKSVLHAVEQLFADHNIPWTNLVSVLMDSCAVMRGSKNGLEIKLRQEKAPQLLDINGDCCHHVHNACKQFCDPFDGWVEYMASDLHNDVKWSADLKMNLREVCEILSIPYTTPQRFLSHRWLSCYDITASNIVMMDAFRVMYYGFMSKPDKALYKKPVHNILNEQHVSLDGKARLSQIWEDLSNKNMTEDGSNRKQRILKKVIIMSKKTDLIMSFYMTVLRLLKDFVLLFQSKAPMMHILYDKQEDLLRNFMACFVKPEVLSKLTAAQLKTLDLTKDEGQFMNKKEMLVGLAAEDMLSKESSSSVVSDFLDKASAAYIKCARHLQKRLPLENNLLRSASAIDPTARGHHLTTKYLKDLGKQTKHFLSPADQEQISVEAHRYQVDVTLPDPSMMEIDEWWAAVKKTDKYPALCKMALTVLTCFHGPMVEGSFNLMGDIINPKSARMNVSTFNAIQTVKYGLKARKTTALQLFKKKDILHTQVDKKLCINMRSAARQQKEQWAQAAAAKKKRLEKLKTVAIATNSSTKARENVKENEKAAQMTHRQEAKRKAVQRLAELAAKRKKLSN